MKVLAPENNNNNKDGREDGPEDISDSPCKYPNLDPVGRIQSKSSKVELQRPRVRIRRWHDGTLRMGLWQDPIER